MLRISPLLMAVLLIFSGSLAAQNGIELNTPLKGLVCDSSISSVYNNGSWATQSYTTYKFDNAGYATSVNVYDNTKALAQSVVFTRNSSHLSTEVVVSQPVNGTMTPLLKIATDYNSSNQISKEYYLQYSPGSSSFDSIEIITDSYDATGGLDTSLIMIPYNGMWLGYSRTTFTNNSSGHATASLNENYSFLTMDFYPSQRSTYTLDANNNVTSELDELNIAKSGTPDWQNSYKTTNSYNASGLPVYVLSQNWDTATMAWVNSSLDSVSNDGSISYTWTNGAWLLTSKITCANGTVVTKPATPTNLTANANNDASITLNWTAPTGTITGYNIYRSNDSTSWAKTDTAIASATTYRDKNLTTGMKYFYKITAYDANGESDFSNVASAITYNTGIASAKIPLLTIYPNPAQNEIIFDSEGMNGTYTLSITDLLGKVMLSRQYNGAQGHVKINVSGLHSGIYNVMLKGDQAIRSARIMISR